MRSRAVHTRSKELVDLHEDEIGDEQIATELRDELSGEAVRAVAAIRRGKKRARVRNDGQVASTTSRR